MNRELPTWSHAQLIVSHGTLTVGVFSSTKPWMPRHKEQRFLGLGTVPCDPDDSPHGGSPLKPLTKSANGTIDEQGFVVLAGEAAGHTPQRSWTAASTGRLSLRQTLGLPLDLVSQDLKPSSSARTCSISAI